MAPGKARLRLGLDLAGVRVVAARAVVEDHEALDARRLAEPHAFLPGRMAEARQAPNSASVYMQS